MCAMYSAVGIAAGMGTMHTLHRVEQVSNTGNPGGVQEGGWVGELANARCANKKKNRN
jgi:hypothetical protein